MLRYFFITVRLKIKIFIKSISFNHTKIFKLINYTNFYNKKLLLLLLLQSKQHILSFQLTIFDE